MASAQRYVYRIHSTRQSGDSYRLFVALLALARVEPLGGGTRGRRRADIETRQQGESPLQIRTLFPWHLSQASISSGGGPCAISAPLYEEMAVDCRNFETEKVYLQK